MQTAPNFQVIPKQPMQTIPNYGLTPFPWLTIEDQWRRVTDLQRWETIP